MAYETRQIVQRFNLLGNRPCTGRFTESCDPAYDYPGKPTGTNFALQTLSTTAGVSGDLNNPNQFPVYFAQASGLAWGFLLDDSEWSKQLMKRFEDAYASGANITIYYDDTVDLDFKIMNSMRGQNVPAVVNKIVYISTGNF